MKRYKQESVPQRRARRARGRRTNNWMPHFAKVSAANYEHMLTTHMVRSARMGL